MAFATAEEHEVRYEALEPLEQDLQGAGKDIVRIPVAGLSEAAGRHEGPLVNDWELWWEKHGYALTRHALDALTRYLGMDPRLIREIGRPQLASELLNDGLKRGGETDYQLVANKRQRRIVVLVSGTYREYRHTEFLHDLRTFTKGASLEVGSCWRDATTVEVNLTADIRVKMGREEDKMIIGLRAVNDIAGRGTVKVEQTVTRLACLNGLSWQPHGVRRQTYHQGHEERFKEKVRALWGAGIVGLEEGSSGIQTLLALEWDKELKGKVVRDPTAGRAIDSLRRPIGCDPRYRPRKYETKESAKAREREHVLGMTSSRAGQRPDCEPLAESPWRTTTLYDVVQDIGAAAVLAETRRERRKMAAVAGGVGERGIEAGKV